MPHAASHPAPARYDPITREIDRDERVILLVLRRRLLARLGPGLAGPRELATLLDSLDLALADAREHARHLNDARINRRGERWQPQPGPPPPPPLAAHTCHGQYLGAFPDLSAVGRMAIVTCLAGPVLSDLSEGSLTALALELHLRGVLWTLDHGGAVHVFRCPDPP
jgi:hypothetical protein